jgi:hypothetical protein
MPEFAVVPRQKIETDYQRLKRRRRGLSNE